MLAPLADALKAALAKTAAEGTLKAMPGRKRPIVYMGMQVGSCLTQFCQRSRSLLVTNGGGFEPGGGFSATLQLHAAFYTHMLSHDTVACCFQGEMSATVMRFASQWATLVQGLRDRVGSDHADVKIGIGLNFNRLDDVTSVSKTYDSSRLSW